MPSRTSVSYNSWEYPGSIPNQSQIGCNQFNPDDSVNFLDFLKTVRSTNVGKDLEITASVGIKPFLNGTGEPMDDVSAFGEVLNRIGMNDFLKHEWSKDQTEIMAYDIWGFWSTAVGPNAPPNDACELVQERDNRVPRSLQSLRGRTQDSRWIRKDTVTSSRVRVSDGNIDHARCGVIRAQLLCGPGHGAQRAADHSLPGVQRNTTTWPGRFNHVAGSMWKH